MSKEITGIIQNVSVEVGAWWLQSGDKLKPEGKRHYWNIIRQIRTGQKVNLSEHIEILSGYDYTSCVNGLKNLEMLRDKNLLVVGNHSHHTPLEGYGETLATSYYVKKATGRDLRWIRERRCSPLHELARQLIDETLDTIPVPVRGKNGRGVRLILEAFKNRDTVGLYLEGGISHASQNLSRGDPTAGRLILKAAEQDIPIVCATNAFKNDTFCITFDILDKHNIIQLSKNEIIQLMTKLNRRSAVGQIIVDYAMETIASHLPKDRHGAYKYPYVSSFY